MTELANEDIRTAIITIVKDVKVNMNIVREMVGCNETELHQIKNVTNKVKNFTRWY